MIRILLIIFAVAGCNSKVSVTTKQTPEEAAQLALQRTSNLILLENQAGSSKATCTPKASMKFVITQNPDKRLFCRDNTGPAQSLSPGPICSGGVSITTFTAGTGWKPCDQMTVCGKIPSVRTPTTSAGTIKVEQLQFDQLPWGCVGDIETAFENETENTTKISKIPVVVTPPPCPMCAATNTETCQICGVDSAPPVIADVAADASKCNEVKFIIFAEDVGSGLHALPYSFDAGATWQEQPSKVYTGLTVQIAANLIRVRDRAGNIAPYARALDIKSDCNCRHAGMLIAHGETKTVFAAEKSMCGFQCQSGAVTCNLGVLSGATANKFASCSQPLCKCAINGQLVDLNQTVDLYKVNDIRCGDALTCEAPANKIQVKCLNVETNQLAIVLGSGPITDYPHGACNPRPCSCVHLGVQLKPTDSPLKVYKKEKPMAPERCGMATNMGSVTCKETNGVFTVQGDIDVNTFKFAKCTDDANLTGPGRGDSDFDVGKGDGGGNGGGIGNDVGDGEGFKRRQKGGLPGSGCDPRKPPYYCLNFGAVFDHDRGFCYLPTSTGYHALSFYEGENNYKQRISRGGFIAGFSRKEVACGDSCSKYIGVIRCDHGVMSEKSKFPFSDCKELCP